MLFASTICHHVSCQYRYPLHFSSCHRLWLQILLPSLVNIRSPEPHLTCGRDFNITGNVPMSRELCCKNRVFHGSDTLAVFHSWSVCFRYVASVCGVRVAGQRLRDQRRTLSGHMTSLYVHRVVVSWTVVSINWLSLCVGSGVVSIGNAPFPGSRSQETFQTRAWFVLLARAGFSVCLLCFWCM